MGLLTDFFLAQHKHVAGKSGTEVDPMKHRHLEGKGVDTLKVEELGKLLKVPLELSPTNPEDTEQWLFALPPKFVSALAKLNDAKRKKVGDQWDAPPDYVDKLCDLARESEETRVPMWFWMSL